MADRPIIFSAPMIRALIDGRKSQTRRALKPQPTEQPAANCHPAHKPRHPAPYLDAYCGEPRTAQNPRGQGRDWHWWQVDDRPGPVACRVPYATGDRLWVRETWSARMTHGWTIANARSGLYQNELLYRADGEHGIDGWWPSIHMPREFSRLTLVVTDVRVQRVQEISEEDAWAEGCKRGEPDDVGGFFPAEEPHPSGVGYSGWDTARDWYADLWDSLHGPKPRRRAGGLLKPRPAPDHTWEANPWVAAISFTVHRCNIDQMGATHGR